MKKVITSRAVLRPPPARLACGHHLLVTLLLRYRLRNQPGLTCKHVAIQVERWQVVAWRQNPRRQNRIRSQSSLAGLQGRSWLSQGIVGGRQVCTGPAPSPAAGAQGPPTTPRLSLGESGPRRGPHCDGGLPWSLSYSPLHLPAIESTVEGQKDLLGLHH